MRRRERKPRFAYRGGVGMVASIRIFVADETGATAIEYGLIASLVALAIIAAISNLGQKLQNTFNEISSNLS
jgi:pilus assembly protein Flp/PilA